MLKRVHPSCWTTLGSKTIKKLKILCAKLLNGFEFFFSIFCTSLSTAPRPGEAFNLCNLKSHGTRQPRDFHYFKICIKCSLRIGESARLSLMSTEGSIKIQLNVSLHNSIKLYIMRSPKSSIHYHPLKLDRSQALIFHKLSWVVTTYDLATKERADENLHHTKSKHN